jgi:hypothetical protein
VVDDLPTSGDVSKEKCDAALKTLDEALVTERMRQWDSKKPKLSDDPDVSEKRVAHRNHVGLLKMNVDIRIRMRGSNVLEREDFAIGVQLVTSGEALLRQGLRG